MPRPPPPEGTAAAPIVTKARQPRVVARGMRHRDVATQGVPDEYDGLPRRRGVDVGGDRGHRGVHGEVLPRAPAVTGQVGCGHLEFRLQPSPMGLPLHPAHP
jgi:hypothetical protein